MGFTLDIALDVNLNSQNKEVSTTVNSKITLLPTEKLQWIFCVYVLELDMIWEADINYIAISKMFSPKVILYT